MAKRENNSPTKAEHARLAKKLDKTFGAAACKACDCKGFISGFPNAFKCKHEIEGGRRCGHLLDDHVA